MSSILKVEYPEGHGAIRVVFEPGGGAFKYCRPRIHVVALRSWVSLMT